MEEYVDVLPCIDCGLPEPILPGHNHCRHRCINCKSKFKTNRKRYHTKKEVFCSICGIRIRTKDKYCLNCKRKQDNYKFPNIQLSYKLIVGDSLVMSEVSDNSIGCVVTSPPYSYAKNYSDSKLCIGKCNTYEEYLTKLEICFKEVYRILIPGRIFALNVSSVILDGTTKWIPQDLYISCVKNIGFIMQEQVIWQKPSSPSQMHRGGQIIQNNYPGYYYPDRVYEVIMFFKKPGNFLRSKIEVEPEIRVASEFDFEFSKKVIRDVWYMNSINATQVGHLAPFPYELPYRVISLCSHYGDVILDPYSGSGSSMAAAKNLGRSYIGYDVDSRCIEVTKKRLKQEGCKDGDFDVEYKI